MGQKYPHCTIFKKHFVVVIYNYGALYIFLLCFDHQDTESESWEMEIGVDGTILTQTNTSKALWDINIHSLQYRSHKLW